MTGRTARAVKTSLIVFGLCYTQPPSEVAAQLSDPCEVGCAAVLGATAFVAATGAAIAVGRASGGMSTMDQGLWVWGTSFALVVGGGFALAGDGERQERSVYAAGIATVVGALTGLGLEAVRTSGDRTRILSGTMIGMAAGAVLGGVYGALTHDTSAPEGSAVPLFTLRLPF